MSVVTLKNYGKLVDNLAKTFPDLYSMMVIDKGGDLHSYFVSEKCAGECDLEKLKETAKLISIRFNIGGFSKRDGGLDQTINVFKENFLIVREISEEHFLAISVSRKTDNLLDRLNTAFSMGKFTTNSEDLKSKSDNELVKVTFETTDFEKSQKEYIQRLKPKRYRLVAEPFIEESEHRKD
ncbi:MAG: hypothetical protein YK1309IOTA_470004 [Marine Group I thaumarchaeote]|nr:MAG: hypothetical protein YK1309IOTA_470004 [Marine Group I thaumarchaeote]